MSTQELTRSAVNFKVARSNLLLVVVLTVVNIFLLAFGTEFNLLFSATIPQLITAFGVGIADEIGSGAIAVIAVVIALAATSVYLICWALSKRTRIFILVALVIFSIETIVFLIVTLGGLIVGLFSFWTVIELAFHGWILYYLVIGTIAWSKLSKVTAEQIDAAQTQLQNMEASSALDDISDGEGE
ncbi:MAG: hypothetical protein FWC70_03730 [Defluviitaleaceae bacterium]|nr:hypothetical protein [Defluviitaleaceae bacterium]